MHLRNAILKQIGVMLRILLVTSLVKMTNFQEFAEKQHEQPKFCSHESLKLCSFLVNGKQKERIKGIRTKTAMSVTYFLISPALRQLAHIA